jgi:hypothetical protein
VSAAGAPGVVTSSAGAPKTPRATASSVVARSAALAASLPAAASSAAAAEGATLAQTAARAAGAVMSSCVSYSRRQNARLSGSTSAGWVRLAAASSRYARLVRS